MYITVDKDSKGGMQSGAFGLKETRKGLLILINRVA
jgi:hypothetical protein